MPVPHPCKDHLGNAFPNQVAMCEYWGMHPATFNSRRAKGSTVEGALTTPLHGKDNIDHEGRRYKSQRAMCAHWHISQQAFRKRLDNGWGLERALTAPTAKRETSHTSAHAQTMRGWSTPLAPPCAAPGTCPTKHSPPV